MTNLSILQKIKETVIKVAIAEMHQAVNYNIINSIHINIHTIHSSQ